MFFGLRLRNIKNTKHGEHSYLTEVDFEESLFRGLKNPVQVGHYHSWVIDHENNFNDWRITAKSDELIMAMSHKKYDLKGLQFHPESILTLQGKRFYIIGFVINNHTNPSSSPILDLVGLMLLL